MTIETKIIADSKNPDGKRIVTVQCKYPRFIHSQIMTHRVFSRNAQSSRACPTETLISEIINNPAVPFSWGKNKKGMQAGESISETDKAKTIWMEACSSAINYARKLSQIELHKETANRILEPFAHINVIITSTFWDNFFELRIHKDAQPEINELAKSIKNLIDNSEPEEITWGDWHLPYYFDYSDSKLTGMMHRKKIKSVACCARVSYNKHNGSKSTYKDDNLLHDFLLKNSHLSPFEHQARAMRGDYANLNGWCSYRWEIENI